MKRWRVGMWSVVVVMCMCGPLGVCANTKAQEKSATAKGSDQSREASEGAEHWLERAEKAMRFERAGDGVLHYHAGESDEQNYQSDRTYPPFFSAMEAEEGWFDVKSGAERVSTVVTFPGGGPLPAQVTLTVDGRAYGFAGEKVRALPATSMRERNLNPWAVVWDWAKAGDARVAGVAMYRDYWRQVLVRGNGANEERLFVDLKTGFPVKLETEEKHYLWGQQKVEYVYTNWTLAGGVMVAGASFRVADGREENARTTGDVDFVKRDAAGVLSVSADTLSAAGPVEELPMFLRQIEPKMTKLGEKTYLLSNPGYNELVTEAGEGANAKVFVLDATQGEVRAKEDAAAIAKLFPGRESEPSKVTVVVTDLAWPHVSGVRWWVSQGATIVAHPAAKVFLEQVVDRKWTMAPDELEKKRGSVKLKFVSGGKVSLPPIMRGEGAAKEATKGGGVTELGGGAIRLTGIDGIGSEVALIAYLPGDKLLWGSDYVQTAEQPTSYADEVWAAAKREGFAPDRVVAEHLQVTDWAKIEELVKKDEEGK